MSERLHQSIDHLRRQAARAGLLEAWSRHGVLALWGAGTLVLILRMGLPSGAPVAPWILGAALPLALVTALFERRGTGLSRAGAAVWLDVRGGAGGQLVSDFERPDDRWRGEREGTLATITRPGLRVPLRPLVLPLAFGLVALLLPTPEPGRVVPPSVFRPSIEEARETLVALEEEVLLESEEARELEERLERLEQEAEDTSSPEATFEALDRLMDDLAERAAEAAEHVAAARENLSEASESDSSEAAVGALEGALSELEAAKLSDSEMNELASALSEELAALPEDALEPLDEEQLARLMELAKALDPELTEALGDLSSLGRLDLAQLAAAGDPGELDLSAFEPGHVCDSDCPPGGT